MRILILSALVLLTTALSGTAVADCVLVEETGTYACASVSNRDNRELTAHQDGVGGASHTAATFEMWGTTYRSSSVYVYTANELPVLGGNVASVNQFCIDRESDRSCELDETSASGTLVTGNWFTVILVQQDGESAVCYETDGVERQCTPLP